jgi:putative hydrolase
VTDKDEQNPEDDFRDMLRDFLSGTGGVDASKLAGAAGLPLDAAGLQAMMSQLQNAMNASANSDGKINWSLSMEQAKAHAHTTVKPVGAIMRAEIDQAFHVGGMWLGEVTELSALSLTPEVITRLEWIEQTMPLWIQLAEPVATSISNAMTTVLTDQAPEEMKGMIANASALMRQIGGTLFAMQLGQIIGQLSCEVVSGGDVGIPLLADGQAALLPQNMDEFGEGLDIPMDQVQLYLAVRELAHARLFRHARWLRLNLLSAITDFARGITIDLTALEEVAGNFDPANPDELRDAMTSGALIPPKTEAQMAALARLETQLALIEGWVDTVTEAAVARLPRASAIGETVRRRRASGGPAESAFASLVGLELRPRRMREASQMWARVTEAVGPKLRDSLWAHPDVMPTAEDLDNPDALIARLLGQAAGITPEPDEIDRALRDLLEGKSFDQNSPEPSPDEPELGEDGTTTS